MVLPRGLDRRAARGRGPLARADAVAARSAAAGIDPASIAGADRFADEVAAESSCRVTLFDAAGAVTGDSQLAPTSSSASAPRRGAPKVVAALAGARATSKRFSTVALSDLVFGAVPIRRDGEIRGVARVGLSTAPFAAAHAAARRRPRLRAAHARGRVRPLELGRAVRDIRGVRSRHRRAWIAGGDLDVRPHRLEGADLADLGRSLEQLAGGLRSTLGELVSERDILSGILRACARACSSSITRGGSRSSTRRSARLLLLRDDVVGRLTVESCATPRSTISSTARGDPRPRRRARSRSAACVRASS
ncbi:MAG: hypothetical protein U0271_02315 [Polyangiaceae bacterium]